MEASLQELMRKNLAKERELGSLQMYEKCLMLAVEYKDVLPAAYLDKLRTLWVAPSAKT